MDHYVDIRLRPDPEFTRHQILGALFAKLHRALVDDGSGQIGISFPRVEQKTRDLGPVLRIHGEHRRLDALMSRTWMHGVRDLVAEGSVVAVPDGCAYRCVCRVQAKSSPDRLRRRAIRRHGLDAETAASRIPDAAAELLDLPFVQLGSRSTKQPRFNLYIKHGEVTKAPTSGVFSTYGLSRTASVPWF